MPAVTIRNVPREVVDELASRAARQGQSMEAYIRQQLIRTASKPSNKEVLERVRARLAVSGTHIPIEEILAARDADRR